MQIIILKYTFLRAFYNLAFRIKFFSTAVIVWGFFFFLTVQMRTCLVLPKRIFPLLKFPTPWPQQRSLVLAQPGPCCSKTTCTARSRPVGGALRETHWEVQLPVRLVRWPLRRTLPHMDNMDELVCCDGFLRSHVF